MKALFIIILCFIWISCSTVKTTPKSVSVEQQPNNLPILELATSYNSGFEKPTQKVIQSTHELMIIWGKIHQNHIKKPALPEVDFSKYDLILVAAGWKKSGGYEIKIKSASVTEKEIIITVLKTSPGLNCINTAIITQPYQLVQVSKTNKLYFFKTEEKVIDCK